MKQFGALLDTFAPVAIVVVSFAIVYFAFALVPAAPAPPQPQAPQAPTLQTHVGRASGSTQLFHIDSITVDGKSVAPTNGGPNAPFVDSRSSDIVVTGWALDSRQRKPASRIIAIVGEDVTVGPITIPRPDVVKAFQLSDASLVNGYQLSVPTSDLSSGRHAMHFLVVGADGGSVLETNASVEFIRP